MTGVHKRRRSRHTQTCEGKHPVPTNAQTEVLQLQVREHLELSGLREEKEFPLLESLEGA